MPENALRVLAVFWNIVYYLSDEPSNIVMVVSHELNSVLWAKERIGY